MLTNSNNTIITKAGETILKETKRGIEFHAFNWQRQRMIHIGTVKGSRYEKEAPVYRKLQAFCLAQSEFGKVQEVGADFITIIPKDKSGTYVIAVTDFDKYKEHLYDAGYGPQWACPLSKFQFTSRIAPRNAILDNPPIQVARDIIEERQQRQMSLWGMK